MRSFAKTIFVVPLAILAGTGCSSMGVEPRESDVLALVEGRDHRKQVS